MSAVAAAIWLVIDVVGAAGEMPGLDHQEAHDRTLSGIPHRTKVEAPLYVY
jgi:hypothetical protein